MLDVKRWANPIRVALLCFFMLCVGLSVEARDFYVTEKGSGAKNGFDWENAHPGAWLEKQHGAISDDRIHVAQGVYRGNFLMRDGIHVIGGYDAKGKITGLSTLQPLHDKATLTHDPASSFKTVWENFKIDIGRFPITLHGEGCLKGCFLTQGYDIQSPRTIKGAINLFETAKLDGCLVSGNDGANAAIYVTEKGRVENCAILFNNITGVYMDHSATLKGCLIARNSSSKVGGILAHTGFIDHCTIVNNIGSIGGIGSAITTTISHCIIWGNEGNEYGNLFGSTSIAELGGVATLDVANVEARLMWGNVGTAYAVEDVEYDINLRNTYLESSPKKLLHRKQTLNLDSKNEDKHGPHFANIDQDNYTVKNTWIRDAGYNAKKMPDFNRWLAQYNVDLRLRRSTIHTCKFTLALDQAPNPTQINITIENPTDTPFRLFLGNIGTHTREIVDSHLSYEFVELDAVYSSWRYRPWFMFFMPRFFNEKRYFSYNPDSTIGNIIPAHGSVTIACPLSNFLYTPPNTDGRVPINLVPYLRYGDMIGKFHMIIRATEPPYLIKSTTVDLNISEDGLMFIQNLK